MSERDTERTGASPRKHTREGDYILAASELDEPILKPGESSRHEIKLELLTALELEVDFEVSCPTDGALRYTEGDPKAEWDDNAWERTHRFGGFDPELRIAEFTNEVQANPDFASTGKARNQRLSLKTKARFGAGKWKQDVSLDHPVLITE
jgi:hypothetical protein